MAKRKTTSVYMHLICGRVGMFDGDQICYAPNGVHAGQLYVDSLNEIRRQQRASIAYRLKSEFRVHPSDYDYLRIRVPAEDHP